MGDGLLFILDRLGRDVARLEAALSENRELRRRLGIPPDFPLEMFPERPPHAASDPPAGEGAAN